MKNPLSTALLAVIVLVTPGFAGNDSNYTYLALGDSIPFGMNPLLLPPYSTQLPTPEQFVGYPETVAATEHLLTSQKLMNASCPGETSGSFLDITSPDLGCNSPRQEAWGQIPPFKPTFGLRANYTGAQIDFIEAQLKANKHINLITLSIGANDALTKLPQLQQCGTDTACAEQVLAPVLQSYAANLAQILVRIRAQYQGTLIMTKYYSPAPALDPIAMAVNGVMNQVADQLAANPGFFPVLFADGFTAFKTASALYNGDACQAGLLIRLPASPSTPPCDIHPSPVGRDLLAATVELTMQGKH